MNHFSFIVLLCIFFAGCSKEESNRKALIQWEGGTQIDQLSWSFNGASLGRGEAGFKAVLEQLERLDESASIVVRYPLRLWNATLPYYELHDPIPFRERGDLRLQFREVYQRKHFLIREEALDPFP